jgi:hypothetical protein
MKTFYNVTTFALMIGLAALCCFAPWIGTPVRSPATHESLGYAAIWSQRFAGVAGARVDPGAFTILAGVVAFFAVVVGAVAYFFRSNRGAEREDV